MYLLDRQYTQRGLAWNRLENGEADRAAAFEEIARRLDCEVALALVDVHETCFTKPSVELESFELEHEGYMGNYGNTVDCWYHRAAVVLWPRERTFVIRAKESPRWALGEVAKTLKKAGAATAATQARRLLPCWAEAVAPESRPGLLDRTLEAAAQLEDSELAAGLLDPFALTGVTPKATPAFVELLARHGSQWFHTLLRHWLSEQPYEALLERLT